MITPVKSSEQLLEGVLDHGLSYVGDYLETHLYSPVLIADHNGWIHFPAQNSPGPDRMAIDIPAHREKDEYFYDPRQGTLYFCIPANTGRIYAAATEIPAARVPETLTVMRACQLAIKLYFSKLNTGNEHLEKELTEFLFAPGRANLGDIIQAGSKEIDFTRPYSAVIMAVEKGRQKFDPAAVRLYINEYMRREKLRTITLFRDNQFAVLIPADEKEAGRQPDMPQPPIDLHQLQESISRSFKMDISLGAGETQPFKNIASSFDQARITIILNRLMGRKNFARRFTEMGIYYAVFSLDLASIQGYCSGILSRLIEHDHKNEGELLPTLRQLLDACGNIKAAADSLYIHVNTLYYRINKIEQILDRDLSQMDTRVELHTAIKIWDTLQILYGTRQPEHPDRLSAFAQ